MYSIFLTAHSLLRWAVIVAGLVAAVRAWQAAASRETAPVSPAGLIFTTLFDVQMLLGLLLYFFLSPLTSNALHHAGRLMSHDVLRFWAVEHPIGMILALTLAHIGRAKLRATLPDVRQRRRAAVYFTVAILIVLLATP